MKLSQRTLSILTVFVLLALAGGGVYYRLKPADENDEDQPSQLEQIQGSGPTPENPTGGAFDPNAAQAVEGAPVIKGDFWITVQAAGRAEARRMVVVNSQVQGLVEDVMVRENQRVAADQVTVQIDSTDYALALRLAEESVMQAQVAYQRSIQLDTLYDDPRLRAQRDTIARIQSGLTSAENQLYRARLDFDRTRVKAPFAGRIADVLVVEGQYIGSGTQLYTLLQLDPIEIHVSVLEAQLADLEEGRRAELRFAAFPREVFVGQVEAINPIVDATNKSARVIVRLPNPAGRIVPGMYADVVIDAKRHPDRVMVPRSAVIERDLGRTQVFVADTANGIAIWRYIETGMENDQYFEVVPSEEGMVEPGEIVLVGGHQYLQHQAPIRLVENAAAAGGLPGR